MTPYRIFLSYSHDDKAVVRQIAQILKKIDHVPHYDQHFSAGTAFTDSIRDFISHAHVFMPVLTAQTAHSHWVHQEIGYATALRIPVLPIAIGEIPQAMIANRQAITVGSVEALPSVLPNELKKINWDSLVAPGRREALTLIEVAEWPEKRAELLAWNANYVLGMNMYGRVRQRGGLSSFSIPDIDITHMDWKTRDGVTPRSEYYRYLVREERRALEQHAETAGCDLLIDPRVMTTGGTSIPARVIRLETLLSHLKRHLNNDKVRIVCSPRARDANVTIVGDWFIAESRVRRDYDGWRHTIFNWHAPTVVHAIRDFDQLFESLLAEYSKPGQDSCRKKAIDEINRLVDELKDTDEFREWLVTSSQGVSS